MKTDWNPVLGHTFDQDYWKQLQRFVADERREHEVYPPPDEVFAALHRTPLTSTRVLVVGQDPYHGPGQANGLAFSVRDGVKVPPSLRNIFVELANDLGVERPHSGDLTGWATQGVLLLNTTLTVRQGQAGSHAGKGWERFTDEVISAVNGKDDHVVFILWGGHARKKKSLIDRSRHTIIESTHPSPLSAHNGFFGSRPFSRTNEALIAHAQQPIDWGALDHPLGGRETTTQTATGD